MPFRQGHGKLGGRRKGTRNLPSKAQRKAEAEIMAAKEAFQAALVGSTQFSPLQVMTAITMLRIGQGDYEGALEAAQAAAPYCHAKLAASEVRVRHSISESSDAEISEAITTLRAKLAKAKALPEPQVTIEASESERIEDAVSQEATEPAGAGLPNRRLSDAAD